jgi:hypothetical protein
MRISSAVLTSRREAQKVARRLTSRMPWGQGQAGDLSVGEEALEDLDEEFAFAGEEEQAVEFGTTHCFGDRQAETHPQGCSLGAEQEGGPGVAMAAVEGVVAPVGDDAFQVAEEGGPVGKQALAQFALGVGLFGQVVHEVMPMAPGMVTSEWRLSPIWT